MAKEKPFSGKILVLKGSRLTSVVVAYVEKIESTFLNHVKTFGMCNQQKIK